MVQRSSQEENIQMVRFFAAAMVLVVHIMFYIHERVDPTLVVWGPGSQGVQIFFIISGFVMCLSGGSVVANLTSAKLFLQRRFIRILPLYWIFTTIKLLAALVFVNVAMHNRPEFLYTIASYLLFPMHSDDGGIVPLHAVGWTLLHEMFFYYLFAIGLALGRSPVFFSSISIVLLWVIGLIFPTETAWIKVCVSEINLHFIFGMYFAILYKKNFKLPLKIIFPILALSVILLVTPDVYYYQLSVVKKFNISAILFVFSFIATDFNYFKKLRSLLIKGGNSSYSMYLMHPIFAPAACVGLYKIGIQSTFILFTSSLIFCIVLSYYLYLYVEVPLTSKISKHIYKKI
jgi:exopolysaccharide production protein ExoZ